jgi:hypothetical protein
MTTGRVIFRTSCGHLRVLCPCSCLWFYNLLTFPDAQKAPKDNKHTSLFPNEDVLTKEIESWKGFADNIRSEKDR